MAFLPKENAFVRNGNSNAHVSESITVELLKCLFPFCFYVTDDGDSILACSGSICHDDCFSLESSESLYSDDDDALQNGSADDDELLYGESIWLDKAYVSGLLVDEFQLRGCLSYLPKSPVHTIRTPSHATRVNTASTTSDISCKRQVITRLYSLVFCFSLWFDNDTQGNKRKRNHSAPARQESGCFKASYSHASSKRLFSIQ